AVFDLVLLGDSNQQSVDLLDRLRSNRFDACRQCRSRWPLVPSQLTELSVARRIDQVKGQFSITESVELLNHQRAKDLFSAQPLCSRLVEQTLRRKILPDQLCHRRMFVEEASDGLQFLGVFKLDPADGKAQLFLTRLAHSGPLFEPISFRISCFATTILTRQLKTSNPECALSTFVYFHLAVPGQELT